MYAYYLQFMDFGLMYVSGNHFTTSIDGQIGRFVSLRLLRLIVATLLLLLLKRPS